MHKKISYLSVLTFVFSVLFSFLAVAIMSYISMATPIGPWVETTIVLIAIIVFYFLIKNYTFFAQSVGLTTAAAGIGGILATGFGFSLPALYFTDPQLFNSWLSQPVYFCALFTGLGLAAGGFGYVMADLWEDRLMREQQLPFPIGELIYKTIFSDNRVRQALELVGGFVGIQLIFLTNWFFSLVQSSIVLMHKLKYSVFSLSEIALPFEQLPLYLSVGFVTGNVIALPLVFGFLIKTLCIDPLYYLSVHKELFLHKIIFPFGTTSLDIFEFTLAFCSGIVLYGTLVALFDLRRFISSMHKITTGAKTIDFMHLRSYLKTGILVKIALLLVINGILFTHFKFSLLAQIYILVFTAMCVYQMLIIAGQIGIVPLGRFATFVMVPGILLFGFNATQAIVVATFVEVSGGVAADVLFGRKLALLSSIEHASMRRYQLLGLITSAIFAGFLLWLFASTLGFEQCGLPAVKAAARALLINIKTFDLYVLLLGCLSGFLLKYTKVNSALLLGGILMPPSISLMLIAGGLASYLVQNKEKYYPFLSGISAGSVVWILLQAITRMLIKC